MGQTTLGNYTVTTCNYFAIAIHYLNIALTSTVYVYTYILSQDVSRHTEVFHVAKDVGTRYTMSILTGRTKMQFLRIHNSVTLLEKHVILHYSSLPPRECHTANFD